MPELAEILPNPPVARVALRNKHNELLLIQRIDEGHNRRGWEFPGGKGDLGETQEQSALRELKEETGLRARITSGFVLVENRIITDGRLAGSAYIMYCAAGQLLGGELRLGDEHTNKAWETFDALMDYDLTPETRKAAVMLGQLALI